MSSVALTGSDTTIINETTLSDLADGDCVNLEFPNNLVDVKVGKNGNSLYAYNATGLQVNVTIRVLAGSSDDQTLQGEYASFKNDPPSYTLLSGEFIKKVGDGNGNITSITYELSGGVVQKGVPTKENVEGDTEQAVMVYTLVFTNNTRTIG